MPPAAPSPGVEVSATVRWNRRWRLELAGNWLETAIDGPAALFEDCGAPEKMAQLRFYEVPTDVNQ